MEEQRKTSPFIILIAGLFFIGIAMMMDFETYKLNGLSFPVSLSDFSVKWAWIPFSIKILLLGVFGMFIENLGMPEAIKAKSETRIVIERLLKFTVLLNIVIWIAGGINIIALLCAYLLFIWSVRVWLQRQRGYPVVEHIINQKVAELQAKDFNALVQKVGQGYQKETIVNSGLTYYCGYIITRLQDIIGVHSESDEGLYKKIEPGEAIDVIQVQGYVDYVNLLPFTSRFKMGPAFEVVIKRDSSVLLEIYEREIEEKKFEKRADAVYLSKNYAKIKLASVFEKMGGIFKKFEPILIRVVSFLEKLMVIFEKIIFLCFIVAFIFMSLAIVIGLKQYHKP